MGSRACELPSWSGELMSRYGELQTGLVSVWVGLDAVNGIKLSCLCLKLDLDCPVI